MFCRRRGDFGFRADRSVIDCGEIRISMTAVGRIVAFCAERFVDFRGNAVAAGRKVLPHAPGRWRGNVGWQEERTALLNRTCGLLAEFGVVIARSAGLCCK
jgi:hypothetical protein